MVGQGCQDAGCAAKLSTEHNAGPAAAVQRKGCGDGDTACTDGQGMSCAEYLPKLVQGNCLLHAYQSGK